MIGLLKRKIKNFAELTGIFKEKIELDSPSKEVFVDILRRNQFSKYLVYGYYDEDLELYVNLDGTAGFVFEAIPSVFMGSLSVSTLHSFFKASLPKGSILQVICHADPYVDPFLETYVKSKPHAPDFVKKSYERLANYYKNGLFGFPVRSFRVYIALKFLINEGTTEEDLFELKKSILDTFSAARIPCRVCPPDSFLTFLRRLFNGNENGFSSWDKRIPLKRQIIMADTPVEKEGKYLKVGKWYFAGLSPKVLPAEIDLSFMNYVTGSYEGIAGDVMQIPSPFMICMTVVFEDQRTNIHSKANLVFQQQGLGSFIVSLKRKTEEYLKAIDLMEQGEVFYPVYLITWVYDTDKGKLISSVSRMKKLWESYNCILQEENQILLPLFVYSLPMCFVYDKKILLLLDREFILPAETIASMLPVQTDYIGTGDYSALLFLGRKGQIVGIDIFSKYSSSYNFFVAAPTGKGKSFLVNYIVTNYLGCGYYVRMIDIGGSYKKLVNMFDGDYIEITPERDICLNPFQMVKNPEEDIPVITQILAEMTRVYTGDLPARVSKETAMNILTAAIRANVRMKGSNTTLDDIYVYLTSFPKYFDDYDLLCAEEKKYCEEDFGLVATHLAFNLHKYTSYGMYGRYFIGDTNVDISSSRFVVLELERLKQQKDLFGAIVLLILALVSQDLYLSDKQVPRLIILDEAWQFLQDTEAFQKVVEEGYRRARKYNGSFGIVTQSVLDFDHFGRVGQVINANTAFKFYLESSDFRKAAEKKYLPFDDPFLLKLMESIKYNAPKYSEIFVYSDAFGAGIVRLAVDPYSYYIYTSNPHDITKIENLVRQGMSYSEAIEYLLGEKESNKQEADEGGNK